MRFLAPFACFAALVLLAACAPPPYEQQQQQQQSVGFGNYVQYQKQREAALAGQQPPPLLAGPGPVNAYAGSVAATGAPLSAGTIGSVAPAAGAPSMADLAAAGIATPETSVAPAPAPVFAGTTATAAAAVPTTSDVAVADAAPADNVGISDEQDFSAVSSRQTIESDKARIEQNKAQYQQIQPGALPTRPGEEVSPVIAYAIAAQNKLGQSVYKRSGLSVSSSEKACQRYASTTEAQEAFLKSGGPKRDAKNLDPDGDGFACRFDPTPFQRGNG